MANSFRFVLVGSGGISNAYLQSIDKLYDTVVVALVSRTGRRPEALAQVVPVFPTLEAVNVGYEAVIVATPNGVHHQTVLAAAELGKHVLVEKVLEISIEKMDQMIETCAKAGVRLGVTFQRRMSPDNIALKGLLEEGALGRLFAASMDVKFYRDQAYYDSGDYRGGWAIDGGGPFIQQAAHNADLLCWFFGMPEKVVSMCDRFDHAIEVEDHGVALLRYANGMIVTFTASTICKPGFPTRLELHTEKGAVVMENDRITQWSVEGVENPAERSYVVHDGATSATVSDTAGHEAILTDFIRSVRSGRKPSVPPESARLATELVLQIYERNVLRVSRK